MCVGKTPAAHSTLRIVNASASLNYSVRTDWQALEIDAAHVDAQLYQTKMNVIATIDHVQVSRSVALCGRNADYQSLVV